MTISDLNEIRTSFVDILQGVHHPRIKYPEQAKEEEIKEGTEPAEAEKDGTGDKKPQPAEKAPSTAAPQPLNAVPTATSRPARLVRRE